MMVAVPIDILVDGDCVYYHTNSYAYSKAIYAPFWAEGVVGILIKDINCTSFYSLDVIGDLYMSLSDYRNRMIDIINEKL